MTDMNFDFLVRAAAAIVAILGLTIGGPAPPEPPKILQVYRDFLKPGSSRAYGDIEKDAAEICARLKCPHAYLAIRSLTGPAEVWFLNAYDSAAEQERVAKDYTKNRNLLAELNRITEQKKALVESPSEMICRYNRELSSGTPWRMGHDDFLVVAQSKEETKRSGTTFVCEDGSRLVIRGADHRNEADALQVTSGQGAEIFRVSPVWSFPARDWIDSNSALWQIGE